MTIHIEVANQADALEILALQKRAFQSEAELYEDFTILPLTQTLENIQKEFTEYVFIKAVTTDGKIVGSARARMEKEDCHICRVIVHPDYQNQGIGIQVMQSMEQVFPNAKRYILETGSKSLRNHHFYQKLGYEIYAEKQVTPKVTLVYMQKAGF